MEDAERPELGWNRDGGFDGGRREQVPVRSQFSREAQPRSLRLCPAPQAPELQLDGIERLDARRDVTGVRLQKQPVLAFEPIGLERFRDRIQQPQV
jgi:hypothetical protein